MNYLELLKAYTKTIETISKKFKTEISTDNGQQVFKAGNVEILVDPEFHSVTITDTESETENYISIEEGAFKGDSPVSPSEFLEAMKTL